MDLSMAQDSSSAMHVGEGVGEASQDSSVHSEGESSHAPEGPSGYEAGGMRSMPPEQSEAWGLKTMQPEHGAFAWPHAAQDTREEHDTEMNPDAGKDHEAETKPETSKDQGTSQSSNEGENGIVKEPVLHTSSNEYRLKSGMSPAGRKRDPVWVLFERIQWGQYHRAKCKSCLKEVQGIPLRMKRHLEICSMSPNAPEKGRANIDPRKKFLNQNKGAARNEQEINPASVLESSMSVGDGCIDKEPTSSKDGENRTLDERRNLMSTSATREELDFKDEPIRERGSRERRSSQANKSEEGSEQGQDGDSSSADPNSKGENGSAGGPERPQRSSVVNGPVPRRNNGMAPGRKKDPIWFSFERTKKGKGHRARCKNCNKEIQGIVHRMKRHLQLCTMSLSPLGKVLGSPVLTVGTSSSTWFMAASSAPIGNRSSADSDGEKAPWEETGEATMLIDRDIVCTCGRNFNDCGTGHPRCRGHSDCFQDGRYLARACDVCRYIWFLADNEGPLQTSAINALRLWKRGFQKNTRHRDKSVDIFVDPVERREFERIVAPYPRHIKVTDPALLALMSGSAANASQAKWAAALAASIDNPPDGPSETSADAPADAPADSSADTPADSSEDADVSSSLDVQQASPETTDKKGKKPQGSNTHQRLGSLEEGMHSVQETLRSLMEALSNKHDSNNDSHSDNDSNPDDNDSNPDDNESNLDDDDDDDDSHADDDSHFDEDSHFDDDSHPDGDLDPDYSLPSNLQSDVTSRPSLLEGMRHARAQAHKSSDEAPTTSEDYEERTDSHPMSDLPLEPETIIQEVYGEDSCDDKHKWQPATGKIRLNADGTIVFPSGIIATKDQVEIQYEGGEVWYRWKPTEEPQSFSFPTYMGKAREEFRTAFKEYCERLFTPQNRVDEPEPEPLPPPPPPPPPKNPTDFSALSFTAACLKDAVANFATVIRTGKYVHEESSLFANVIVHGSNTSSFIQEAKDIFHGKNLDPEVTSQKLQLQITSVDNKLLDAEFQSRKQLWNAISSLAIMEGTAKAVPDPKSVATYNTLAKTALPNLCSDITTFFLAKFEVRKAYLNIFDNRNPHYFALMYSSPWCSDLFPAEVMWNLVRQAEAHCKPVAKMLGKNCSKPVKKRSAAPQPSVVPEQRARLSETASREHTTYPYKPGRDYRSHKNYAQELLRPGTDYSPDQSSSRGDENLALYGGPQFKASAAAHPSSSVDSSLSGGIGAGANGPFYAPSKEWDSNRSLPPHYTNPSGSS